MNKDCLQGKTLVTFFEIRLPFFIPPNLLKTWMVYMILLMTTVVWWFTTARRGPVITPSVCSSLFKTLSLNSIPEWKQYPWFPGNGTVTTKNSSTNFKLLSFCNRLNVSSLISPYLAQRNANSSIWVTIKFFKVQMKIRNSLMNVYRINIVIYIFVMLVRIFQWK